MHSKNWPGWPVWDTQADETRVLEVLRSGIWSRAGVVTEFEKKWAEAIGAKRALAVVNGTNALIASLVNLGIGGGDEVIVLPTHLLQLSLRIANRANACFADIDRNTFQIDPEQIELKINPRNRGFFLFIFLAFLPI